MPLLKFRIAAIRETFEESGILVVKPREKLAQISLADLAQWRELVSSFDFGHVTFDFIWLLSTLVSG